jgi:tetratricopeptide (TPR) repeat protein
VARTIEAKFPALKEAHPEVLARHWTEAGETEPAITEWSKAGKAAEGRYAFREASESYQKALELLNLLPESPERDLRELQLRQSVVRMLYITKGYSAPETIEAAERAATLAKESGNLRQLLNFMIVIGVNGLSSGDLSTAGAQADQALELALREGSSGSLLGRVHALQMMVRYYRGDLFGVEKHFATGRKFFEGGSFRRVPGGTPAAFGTASWNAWTLGRADVAREYEKQMIAAANRDSPYEMAFLGHFAAQLGVWTGDYDKAERLAAQALELSEEYQFPWLAALSRATLGQARAQLGHAAEGIALIRQGMAGLLEIESRFSITKVAASLAEARLCERVSIDTLETFEQALNANPDELVYRPEIFRQRGELRLKLGQPELAEADFREAIALAQKMGAKAWELRATMSLARLLTKQDRRDEARAMLAEIYGWFTEGFDTADLKDAKALMEEL